MLTTNDFINIFLPVLSHWLIWLIFFVVVVIILILYAYPYVRKPRKESPRYHVGIPITNIISLYIFTKMLESVFYQGSILKIDAWFNAIVYSSFITKIAFFITNLGGSIMIAVLSIIAIVFLLYKKRWRYAVISTITIVGASLLQLVIKDLVQRVRPENLIENTFSFPSGHAISAIAFVCLLIYSFKDDLKNKTVKYVLIILFSSFFIAVGISRIILHVHWFSDVIAGMSLGLFWFMLLVLIERSIPGLKQAVKVETKEAKSIVPQEAIKTVKSIIPIVTKK
ncbi:MAG: phosphatase PAP2 family protein [Candidatus Pacearchaeota archaeon]|nr:phosphatase PAP2 family protein [Candidatus Pacearchaeota archaeon]